ncbi:MULTISPECIES: hypothetical protein [Nocardioides]|uniref:DUF2087 domain-containing protein n=1 Tax=Nocardioides vastitatis TaxID=2568655 RepID=A0ABW0ZMP2_9ACTN|nr:hypothetical protein [Nocardioides sp.]THJ06221.1 hypothetical protein E7Z54_06285 [Nocardioides sp.]
MEAERTRRQVRRELTDRLMVEYAGAVPAGQVLAAVVRIDRLLSSYHPSAADRMALCEELVRHRLVERIARTHQPRLARAAS